MLVDALKTKAKGASTKQCSYGIHLEVTCIYGYYVLTANTFGQFVTKMEALIEEVSNV
jgi:hypothetical protein